ncbi:MAG TPA: alpha/beta fold hydrolase [Candidatus Saccharimonadales bacterium]|nr:alpha/beta fold hydrolase [Candidatus Saccharimonadales bacterium]
MIKKTAKKDRAMQRLTKRPSGLAMVILALIAGLAVFIVYDVWHSHTERGQYGIADTYAGENLYRSLDLKVTAKARYYSSPIRIYKDLGKKDGLHQQEFEYDVKDDGLTEYGLVVKPSSCSSGGCPVLILLHGYINPRRYRTDRDYLSDMEFYARHGFLVVKPDLRGQGLSIHSGSPVSAYYSIGYNTDVMSLISAIKQTKGMDASNISLWGHSLGAYIALRAAVLSPDIKNTILLSGPVDSLEEMYITYLPPSDENNPNALADRANMFAKYGTPAENPSFWRDASPIYFLSHIKGRVQIHVGLRDTVVAPKFSADLNSALNKAGISHQYYTYPDGRHSLWPQRSQIYSRSLRLLEEGLPLSSA